MDFGENVFVWTQIFFVLDLMADIVFLFPFRRVYGSCCYVGYIVEYSKTSLVNFINKKNNSLIIFPVWMMLIEKISDNPKKKVLKTIGHLIYVIAIMKKYMVG